MLVHMRRPGGCSPPKPATGKICYSCNRVYVFVNIPLKYCPNCGHKLKGVKVS